MRPRHTTKAKARQALGLGACAAAVACLLGLPVLALAGCPPVLAMLALVPAPYVLPALLACPLVLALVALA